MGLEIILVVAAALFVSWMIGANSVSTTFGPAVGLGAGGVLRGAFLAGLFGLIGAVVQGGRVAGTVGSGLLTGGSISMVAGSIVLLTASILIIIGVFFEIPIPTAFTVVGGVLGVGLGLEAFAWNLGRIQVLVAIWLAIPFVAVALGYLFSRILRSLVGRRGADEWMAALGILAASFCAFAAGGNLIGLAIGPLVNVLDIPAGLMLFMGGVLILLGAWTGGPRIVSAVSKEYSELGIRRTISTLATASIIAQTATFFGIPVSFNETVICSLVGSGLSAGAGRVQLKKILSTALGWVIAFFVAVCVTWVAVFLFI